jgi:hypothetical protein
MYSLDYKPGLSALPAESHGGVMFIHVFEPSAVFKMDLRVVVNLSLLRSYVCFVNRNSLV